jgi:hypothetical protein
LLLLLLLLLLLFLLLFLLLLLLLLWFFAECLCESIRRGSGSGSTAGAGLCDDLCHERLVEIVPAHDARLAAKLREQDEHRRFAQCVLGGRRLVAERAQLREVLPEDELSIL